MWDSNVLLLTKKKAIDLLILIDDSLFTCFSYILRFPHCYLYYDILIQTEIRTTTYFDGHHLGNSLPVGHPGLPLQFPHGH